MPLVAAVVVLGLSALLAWYFFSSFSKSSSSKLGPSISYKEAGIPVPEEFDPASVGSPHTRDSEKHPDCCNHPYWHKVYKATSFNGTTWNRENVLIEEHASVPAILEKDDGSFILYYVNGDVDTMDCSVSQDGKDFTKGGCTIYGFTENKVWDPYIVKIENGFYRMYFYAPSKGLVREEQEHKIMSAISKDGINWLQEEGPRFEYQGIIDPAVIKMGGVWRMYTWYPKDAGGPGNSVMVSATSNDGLNFQFEKEFNVGGGIPEIVEYSRNRYRMYFCEQGISAVTSTDGLDWSRKQTVLPAGPGEIVCDPSVIKSGGEWVMYYKVQEVNSSPF